MRKIIFTATAMLSVFAGISTLVGLLNNDKPMIMLGLFEFLGFACFSLIVATNQKS